MKVRISINKSTALKAGKDRYGYVVVDVPAESLTPLQRETLADCTSSPSNDNGFKADFYLDMKFTYSNPYGGIEDTVSDPTSDEVRRLLDHIATVDAQRKAEDAQRKAEDAAEDAAKAEAAKAKYAANLAEWKARPVADRIEKRYFQWQPTWDCGDGTPEHDEAIAECERRNAAEKAEEAEKAALAKAAKDAGIAALHAWAVEHGSATLKARIEDGYEWIGLAQSEYGDSVVAELGEECGCELYDEDPKISERTTPTLEEIEAVRSLRKRLEGKPATVALKWVEYTATPDPEDYDSGDPETSKRAELCVKVTTPTGSVRVYYYLPAAVVATA